MPKKKKPAHELTDKELVKHLFPHPVRHHVRKVAGIDAVGIGSDYDGVQCTPVGLEDVAKFPALTRALKAKGYKDAGIRKIYGGNVLRVMRAVEKGAASRAGN